MKLLAFSVGGYQINTPGGVPTVNTNGQLNTLLHNGISFFLYVIILLSFIFVLIGGLKWMLSQGDKKAVDEARKTVTFAIGGLILAFLSFFIINLIGYAVRVPLLNIHP